jgi:hypothetical protein
VRSKALTKSTIKEATNYGKNKNNTQLNNPDPPPLKSPHGTRLHYSTLSGKSYFPAHTRTRNSTLPLLLHYLIPSP